MIFNYVTIKRKFFVDFHYLGWHCLSLGIHIDPRYPVVELHLPAGFLRVGWNMPPTHHAVRIGLQPHHSFEQAEKSLYGREFADWRAGNTEL